MYPVLATLDRHCDGILTGLFRTLVIRSQLELRPEALDGGLRSYRAVAAPDFHFGQGEQRGDPATAPIDLVLRAPELARPIRARAVLCDRGHWELLWLDP